MSATHDGPGDEQMPSHKIHRLRCDDAPLPKGARAERHWSCTCGVRYFGYDGAVRAQHQEHMAAPAREEGCSPSPLGDDFRDQYLCARCGQPCGMYGHDCPSPSPAVARAKAGRGQSPDGALGYVVISGQDFVSFMQRAATGEDPDLLFAELYANSDTEVVGGADD